MEKEENQEAAQKQIVAGGQLVAELLAVGPVRLREASAALISLAAETATYSDAATQREHAELSDGLRVVGGRLAAIAAFLER